MKQATEPSKPSLQGIASLFDDFERKELFKKYLFFLGWVEIFILGTCWVYHLGNGTPDQHGLVSLSFPWNVYFLVAFLAPVAITFLLGVVIVGFNRYFSEPEQPGEIPISRKTEELQPEETGHLATLHRMVSWVQKLPFLGLLVLLALSVAFLYKLGDILAFLGNVGEKTVTVILFSAIGLVAIVSVFVIILIFLNFHLRKKAMDYQYRSEVAERFGLVILDDATVLNSEGKLLVTGKKVKGASPRLPAKTVNNSQPGQSSAGVLPRPADPETT
jgi:hypothetical protein